MPTGDAANVVVFPPLLYAGTLLLGLLLHFLVPLPWKASVWPLRIAGVGLLIGGALLARWAETALHHAGTNVRPDKPTTAIVSDGPFRHSRNPLYLATTLVYAGWRCWCPRSGRCCCWLRFWW